MLELAGDLSPELAEALRLPDELSPGAPNEACPARAYPLLFIVLASDDSGYRPRIPISFCGEPRDEVYAALEATTWRTVWTIPIDQPR